MLGGDRQQYRPYTRRGRWIHSHRWNGNAVLDHAVHCRGRLGDGDWYTRFKLTEATEATLKDATVKAGDTDVTVRAYTGGKLDAKISDPVFERVFPNSPSAISLVATTSSADVMKDLKWLQFNWRSDTVWPGGTATTANSSPKLNADLRPQTYYYGKEEWVVDSSTPNSAFHEQASPTVRGTSGQNSALAMYDAPGFPKNADDVSETFKSRTYLVYKKEIIYTVEWSITITKKDGVWSDPTVTIDKRGPGRLDFPVDINAAEWVWRYSDAALTTPVKVSNPLK